MKKNILFPFFIIGGLFWLQFTQTSCVNDKLPDTTDTAACDSLMITYDNQVKPIIDASCAVSGCHVAAFPFGDFSTYAMMTPFLSDSKFKKEVIETMDMPTDPIAPLTDAELEIMNCWVKSNYPEN